MGRRCGWCGVGLRWWQLNHCRVCSFYFRYDHPSPPCASASRWDAARDNFGAEIPPRFPLSIHSSTEGNAE